MFDSLILHRAVGCKLRTGLLACGLLAFAALACSSGVMAQDSGLRMRPDAVTPELRAQLTARQYTTLSGEMAGRLDRIATRPGERFKTGDVLVVFDCVIQRAQLARAKAVEQQAEKTLAINRRLVQLKSIGQLEFEISEAEVAKAKADRVIADATVSRCSIAAPFNGVTVDQKAREFQYANPGQPLLDLLDDSNLEVELIVPSRWVGWLKPGFAFDVHVDEIGKTFPARISRLGGRLDPVSQSVRIFADINAAPGELMAGMSGRAIIAAP